MGGADRAGARASAWAGYAAAWATTDRFGASRAIAWLESDTGDIHRFPSRVVAAGDDALELRQGEPLDLAAVWPSGEDPEAFLEATETAAFLVVQDDSIRYEGYFYDTRPDELRTSFSSVKSVVSTLIGLAIYDGAIGSVDDPITDYLPELLEREARFGDVTIRHLLTMSSGLLLRRAISPVERRRADLLRDGPAAHGPVSTDQGAARPHLPVQQLQPPARRAHPRAGDRPTRLRLSRRAAVGADGR